MYGGERQSCKIQGSEQICHYLSITQTQKKDSANAAKPNQRLCPCTSLGVPPRTLIMCSHSALGMCSKCSLEFYLN